MVFRDLDKEREQGSGCQSHGRNAMGKQSLFQSLYNKYNRKNIYSNFSAKVIITWIFPFSIDCLVVFFGFLKFADLTCLIFFVISLSSRLLFQVIKTIKFFFKSADFDMF